MMTSLCESLTIPTNPQRPDPLVQVRPLHPSARAAPETFQFDSSSARRMCSRSADSRASWIVDFGAASRCTRISTGIAVARQPLARRQDRHALDHVAQLAGIARPAVAFEQRRRPPRRASSA